MLIAESSVLIFFESSAFFPAQAAIIRHSFVSITTPATCLLFHRCHLHRHLPTPASHRVIMANRDENDSPYRYLFQKYVDEDRKAKYHHRTWSRLYIEARRDLSQLRLAFEHSSNAIVVVETLCIRLEEYMPILKQKLEHKKRQFSYPLDTLRQALRITKTLQVCERIEDEVRETHKATIVWACRFLEKRRQAVLLKLADKKINTTRRKKLEGLAKNMNDRGGRYNELFHAL